MSHPTQNIEGMSIPQFGGWDEKGATNYSMVFLRVRDKRKQCKSDIMCSLANDHNFAAASSTRKHDSNSSRAPEDFVTKKKKIKFLTYINCCFKP
ncbi:hypothetical protein like AT5G19473 [Hibiscus trionum]|uniref:RIN4 pathogenic type III effector avirulence factor Avr cleavage site domain-containing protein n=1 Tax=Hibiscus trionum TaxID=183268 RepID=A0A9W7HQ92_HIBTR|nr:hypothetical protein like AT5G19473 [Hibiscus trionum]